MNAVFAFAIGTLPPQIKPALARVGILMLRVKAIKMSAKLRVKPPEPAKA